jgi:CheY-like chemotaxis protein
VQSGPVLADLSGVQVLVVDDDRDALAVFTAALTRAGASVLAVPTAAAALAGLGTFRPAVLVSDVVMPLRDGFWLLRELRGIPGFEALPALAVTGCADVGAALGAGFDLCLRKPVDPVELCAAVAMLARRVSSSPRRLAG